MSMMEKMNEKIKENSEELRWLMVDRLFFHEKENNYVENLKESGRILSALKDELEGDERNEWTMLLGKQIRFSIDRARKRKEQK